MHVYAVSDLHGCLDLYKQIKDFIQPEDKVYMLGDCGDRGPQSWETIKVVYEDPQFIYLKGNHEDMLVKSIDEWLYEDQHLHGYDYRVLCHNGGEQTFKGWKNGPERNKWFRKIQALPTKEVYVNTQGQKVILSHAGLSPEGENDFAWGEDLLWDREHFYEPWTGADDMIVVHGHTPFVYMVDAYDVEKPQCEEMPEDEPIHAVWYCEHHKVCIDAGAVFTGQTILLDLDTFEEHYFYIKE